MTSPRRHQILVALAAPRGYPPTIRELATEVGGAYPTVRHHLLVLQRAGLVTWEPGVARTLRLTEAGRASLNGVETP